MESCRLPQEMVENMLDDLRPRRCPIALPASDIITQTVRCCLLLCKSTLPYSQRLLYESCLYIDSPWRLQALLRSYGALTMRSPAIFQQAESRRLASISLYLSPFPSEEITDMDTVKNVQTLFQLLSHTLRRLVIDMPLRSVDPEEPSGHLTMQCLRRGFEQLQNLEEFVSVRDELYTSTSVPRTAPQTWTSWPNLKRLALHNVLIDDSFWNDLSKLPLLEVLVLTGPDGSEELDMLVSKLKDSTRVLIINTSDCHDLILRRNGEWFSRKYASAVEAPDGSAKSTAENGEAILEIVSVSKEDGADDIEACQEWVKRHALLADLW